MNMNELDKQYYYIDKCKEYIQNISEELGRPLTAAVSTFGCQMNSHDSEKLKGILEAIGFVEIDSEEADLVIFNTCTIRENANKKLYGHLGHIKNMKKQHQHKIICLCGCMMQEPHVIETIKEKYKFVDVVFGIHNIYKLAELLCARFDSNEQVIEILEKSSHIVETLPSKRKYTFKSGVNIMYGCNNFCTYCIVPYVRGRERSRLPKDIFNEIKQLANDGVKEIMLLGQNVNSYGTNFDFSENDEDKSDITKYDTFPKLLREICKIKGIKRIRFMTSHPKDLSDELIEVIASEDKICNHIHLPVQSGSSKILDKMNRRYTKEHYLNLVDKLREANENISLTTDIIVGFPGETDEDILETLDVVKKAKFDQAYTFIYSKRTGTPAAAMEDQVPAEITNERFQKLLKIIREIAHEHTARFTDEVKEVLVEEVNGHDKNLVTGRTSENVTVHFPGTAEDIGTIVLVKLSDCKGFYYLGERI